MEHNHSHHPEDNAKPGRWVIWFIGGLVLIAAYFVIGEHWVHVSPYLPFLFLLACPFMHFFMHGNHGHGGHHHESSGPQDPPPADTNRPENRP